MQKRETSLTVRVDISACQDESFNHAPMVTAYCIMQGGILDGRPCVDIGTRRNENCGRGRMAASRCQMQG